MTVAAKANLGSTTPRPKAGTLLAGAGARGGVGDAWRRLWQVPLVALAGSWPYLAWVSVRWCGRSSHIPFATQAKDMCGS